MVRLTSPAYFLCIFELQSKELLKAKSEILRPRAQVRRVEEERGTKKTPRSPDRTARRTMAVAAHSD